MPLPKRRGNKVKGVQFTVMVVGLYLQIIVTWIWTCMAHKDVDTPDNAHAEERVRIKPVNVELEEEGANYDDILAEQSRIKRNPRFRDNRVHALLYFYRATGHHLREIDIELMRRLSPRVNVIPVREDIDHHDIPIYNFPYDRNMELRALLPFAVIGSEEEIDVNGEPVRARIYPWGIAEVDNPEHSDFGGYSHLPDLKMLTEDVLYETYRTEKLSRSVHSDIRSLRAQSVRLKREQQLRRDEEKREINEKRQELLAKEESLRNLESRLAAQGLGPEASY
ncbi:chloride channel protein [Favolaschia claudopus]|uniref:Chloride channel protein n=1 Tax=Favolaschia claudopus TaxID=2862362 RepID=A0AAW0AA00_9AGAR